MLNPDSSPHTNAGNKQFSWVRLVWQDEATPSFSTGHKKKGANYTAPMNFVSGGIVGQDKNKKKNKKKEEDDEEVEEVEERGRQGDSSDSDDGGKSLITMGCGAPYS